MDFDRLMKYQQYREKYEDLYNKVDKAIINYIERDDIKRQIERRMMDYERYTKLSNPFERTKRQEEFVKKELEKDEYYVKLITKLRKYEEILRIINDEINTMEDEIIDHWKSW